MQIRIITIFTFMLAFAGLNAQKTATNAKTVTSQTKKPGVHMTFDKEKIKLGDVKKGTTKDFTYTFTNSGTETIEIEIVSGCDCTTLDWTRKPIKPGEKGTIKAHFDSKEKDNSDPVDVDVYLKNIDPKTKAPIMKILGFEFNLIK